MSRFQQCIKIYLMIAVTILAAFAVGILFALIPMATPMVILIAGPVLVTVIALALYLWGRHHHPPSAQPRR